LDFGHLVADVRRLESASMKGEGKREKEEEKGRRKKPSSCYSPK
jgi:hypothetical protein